MKFAMSITNRGFRVVEFHDRYDAKCSIQQSSLATEEAIWFGVDNPEPKIMASKTPQGGTGWVPYPISDDVLINTRMHLTREQVKALLPILQHFVATGSLIVPSDVNEIDELLCGMTATLDGAKASLMRFEIDLNITNHALLGQICTFVEFMRTCVIDKKQAAFERALGLLKEVLAVLSQMADEATDDDLFTDVHYYVTKAEEFLERNKE